MRKTIKIGEREIDFVANGMTAVIYGNVFHKDLLAEIFAKKKDMSPIMTQELAFIMAAQATKSTKELMTGITIEEYWEWCEGFNGIDLVNSEILSLFVNQQASSSTPKKKKNRRIDHTTQRFTY